MNWMSLIEKSSTDWSVFKIRKKKAKEEEDLEIESKNAKLKKMMVDQEVSENGKKWFLKIILLRDEGLSK